MQTARHLLKSPIIITKQVGQEIYLIRAVNSELVEQANSGQFVNIRITNGYIPFWRRPFSIHRVDREKGWFDILFAVLGVGTKILAASKPGDELDILGPLGNHFTITDGIDKAILVAGGMGIAPLLFLAEELAAKGIPIVLFYGTKSNDTMCCLNDLEKLGISSVLTTEDGSKGEMGFVTDQLEKYLNSSTFVEKQHIFTCGPIPMLAKVQSLALEYHVPGQVSIETLMACGIGVCNGCAVETTDSFETSPQYLLACKDGPVFNIDRIRLND